MPLARPEVPTTTRLVAGRRHLGRRRAALRPVAGRRLLLRPAEVPGLRRRPLAGRRARPRPSSASSGIAASDRWIPASLDLGDRARQLPQGPDLQHAGAGHDLPGRASRSSGSTTTAASSSPPAAARPVGRDHLRLGRGRGLRHAVRGRPRRCAATSSPPSTSTTPSTPTPSSPVLRANGIVDTESLPQARAATSSGSPCSRPSTRPTSRPSPPASTTSSPPSAEPASARRSAQTARRPTPVGRPTSRRQGDGMTTLAEVRAQLTGPGGPFEVITEVVDGVEMQVYKDRLPHLRAVGRARRRRAATRSRSSSTATAASASPSSSAWPTRCRPRWPATLGVGHGDRVAVLSANNPEWCLASGPPSTSARSSSASTAGGRPTRSSTACRTAGPRCWWPTAALRAHRRPARPSSPTSRPCSSSTPTPPTSATTRVCTASTS